MLVLRMAGNYQVQRWGGL